MMRRGGHRNNVRVPWRGHDDAIPSALHILDRVWAARTCVQIIVLAASSIAISLLIWSLRPGLPRVPQLPRNNHQSGNGGFVLPLYHYYQRLSSGDRVVGGRARWRGRRRGNGRGIRSDELKTLFNLHGGHRPDDSEIEQFYIEMKVGNPPKPFYFHIDTGSGPMWVYCTDRGHASSITDFGPHGMFDPPKDSYANCTGPTAAFCQALQAKEEQCDRSNNFECIFSAEYVDGSDFAGLVVNGSITLPMRDRTERNVFGLFGCVIEKESDTFETLPLVTDGIIGLGNCMGTLLDQLSRSKAMSRNVLGVCLAKDMQWLRTTLPADQAVPMGFISLGMSFDEKFDQSNSVWVKMAPLSSRIPCAYAANLLSITIGKRRISVSLKFPDRVTVGIAMGFDTGSDYAFLDKTLHDKVLKALETYTTNGNYFRTKDNEYMPASDQRVCWQYHGVKRLRGGNRLTKASPIHEFRPIELGFEGITSAKGPAPPQYLIIQPENYLSWDEEERKVCVNILQDTSALSVSNIGSQAMREHLFVFDIKNQQVRWKLNSNCET